ncbi:hypothetical protein RUND412_011310 [Rhizina undulata]
MSQFCYKDGEGYWCLLVKTNMQRNMQRPFVMSFTEPICMFWAIYIAVIYGILYLCFTANPVFFSEIRHWSPGISGLAFCGIGSALSSPYALIPSTGKSTKCIESTQKPENHRRKPE